MDAPPTPVPRALRQWLARFLEAVPGYGEARMRRAVLTAGGLHRLGDRTVPDDALGEGWHPVVLWLTAGASPEESAERLLRLLAITEGDLPPHQVAECHRLREALTRVPAERQFASFLALLGLDEEPDAGAYAGLDQLFVPPVQYDAIREILDRHHVVFILGDPHMGKTYSALRILWEEYRDHGRSPVWLRNRRIREALAYGDLTAERIRDSLREGDAFYLEDPFGQTVPFDAGRFAQSLRSLVVSVAKRDVRLVITSRTAVFDKVVTADLSALVVRLSQELQVGASYSSADLEAIARNYATAYDVRWATEGGGFFPFVHSLPAPHNIEEFLRSTRDYESRAEALALLPAFRDIVTEYGRLIGAMPPWQQTFLAIAAYASGASGPTGLARHIYGDLGSTEGARVSWESAQRSLAGYTLLRAGAAVLRHPSIGEGLELAARADAVLLERIWRIVEALTAASDTEAQLAGLQALAIYGDLFGEEERGRRLFRRVFDSDVFEVRRLSRLAVIAIIDRVSAEAARHLFGHAEGRWSDPVLLRLLLARPDLVEITGGAIAETLASSTDEQTRYLLATSLGAVIEPRSMTAQVRRLLTDSSRLVRRMAFVSVASRVLRQPSADERDLLTELLRTSPVRADRSDASFALSYLADRFGEEAERQTARLGLTVV